MNYLAHPTQSVAIIGGGASGVLLAAQLLRDPATDVLVTLIEKAPSFGRGLAYGTPNPEHVLNIPARGMSAFPDDPDHFLRWLRARDETADPDAFPPRSHYGHYLAALLSEADDGAPRSRLTLVRDLATDLEEQEHGVLVRLASGGAVLAHAAVLAVGHEERQIRGRAIAVRAGSTADTLLDPEAPVMVLGSGLSMVDAWLTLASRNHRGPIHVVSRHGFLPQRHEKTEPLAIAAEEVPFGASTARFARWFVGKVRHAVAAGGDWRGVVDGLRPHNQRIWQSWSTPDRRRFLRYVRPLWNIHRHRLPPALHDRLVAAVESGQITLIAGEFLDVVRDGDAVVATLRRRGRTEIEEMRVARVYDCGGVAVNVASSSNRLIQGLVGAGRARPDPLRIGLDVTQGCALIDSAGIASERLFAIGPLTRSTFFEVESVPEIRVQAARLAERLLAVPPASWNEGRHSAVGFS